MAGRHSAAALSIAPSATYIGHRRVAPLRKGRAFQNLNPHEWGSYPGSSAPVSPVLALVGFVGLCLLVGAADGAIIAEAKRGWYLSLTQPAGTPPDWLSMLIGACVHTMLGVAGWLVWRHAVATRPLRLWGWQLATNVLWAPAFYAMHSPMLAIAVNLVLLVQIAFTARAFAPVRRPATWLLAPYFVWTGYVTYLTAAFWWLNQF